MNESELLARAASAHGIELSYTDTWGNTHHASPAVLRALLAAQGFEAGGAEDIERKLAEQEADQGRSPLAASYVVRDDAEFIRLNLPAESAGETLKLEIEWENGDVEHHPHWAPELPTLETRVIDAIEYVAKRLPLPKPLRTGYHHIRVLSVRKPRVETLAEARFTVCPRQVKPVDRKMAGLALSLYGLRSRRNWGCGDFTDLEAVIDQFAPAGAAFVALNPLHAIANRQPYNTSPYLPQSAFFRNFIYIDVERAGDPRLDHDMRVEIAALRASDFVEYERVAALKLKALTGIFERFLKRRRPGHRKHERFAAYTRAQGELLQDYAVYCALDEEMHRRDANVWLWSQWPVEYRDPRSVAVLAFAEQHRDRVLFFKFLQWQIQLQAAEAQAHARKKGMPIGLYHDLALATDRFGADLWAERRFYATGCRSGAPPDELAPSGQDWGFPAPNREAHHQNGYRIFAQSIRNAAACGGALRMDHVMRLFRLFVAPEGFEIKDGAYVKDYAQDLLGILALESQRENFSVIGEDLGTVTDEGRAGLAETGILSYRLLWFERDGAGNFHPPGYYPANALASTTTHDLPTLAGYAAGRDLEARKAAGMADENEYQQQKAHRANEVQKLEWALGEAGFAGDPLGFLLATPCLLVLLNQEDLTGETEQQNLPGSTWQYPNWRRKMKVAVEECRPLAQKFRVLVEKSGRRPPHS